MESNSSLNKKRDRKPKGLFLIGLMVSLGLTLMAFEWATFDVSYQLDSPEVAQIEVEDIIEVRLEPPKPKKAYKKPEPLPSEKIELIKDDKLDPEDKPEDKPIDDNQDDSDDDIEEVDDGDETGSKGPIGEDAPFVIVEEMPLFPGGEVALYTYLGKNIHHTQCSKETGISQKVYVQFVIEKDGSISNIGIPRKVGCGLDEIVIKAVEKMPTWSPGKQRGKPVRVKYTLPVQFSLKPY